MATYATTNNKPSEQAAKDSLLKNHLLPAIGSRCLDQITGADVETLKARLLRTEKNPDGVSRKRVNNILHVLSRILTYAVDVAVLDQVPRIKTLKLEPQKFDFFTFEEFERLVAATVVEPEWRAAVLVAGRRGCGWVRSWPSGGRTSILATDTCTSCARTGEGRWDHRRAGRIGRCR